MATVSQRRKKNEVTQEAESEKRGKRRGNNNFHSDLRFRDSSFRWTEFSEKKERKKRMKRLKAVTAAAPEHSRGPRVQSIPTLCALEMLPSFAMRFRLCHRGTTALEWIRTNARTWQQSSLSPWLLP